MNPNTQFERDLEQWLQTEAPASAPAGFHATVMDRARTLRQRPGWTRTFPARRFGRGRGITLLAAAALLLVGGALAAGSGLLRLPTVVPPVPAPSVVAVATASPDATSPSPSESAAPSASPIPVAGPGGVWIATGTMGTPRDDLQQRWVQPEHAAVRLLDGRVLVVGGNGDDSEPSTAELYDPASGTWSATGDMLRPRGGFPATLLRDGTVLVGDVDDLGADDQVLGAEVYDPATGTWSATGKMVSSGGSTATLLRDGKVLVIGYDDTGELYDPDSGTWTATGKMTDTTSQPYSHPAARWQGARGGRARARRRADRLGRAVRPGHGVVDRDREHARQARFDRGLPAARWQGARGRVFPGRTAVSRTVRPGDRGLDRHRGAARVRLPNGNPDVRWHRLVAGLYDPSADPETQPPCTAAALYDPRTGSWTTASSMLRCGDGSSFTLLLDGTVLVAGGSDCNGDGVCVANGAAELYVPAGVSPPPLRPSRARPRQSSRARPRGRRRSRPRPVPFRRTLGPGRSRLTTRAPSPRRCSWPRRTRAACSGWSGPRLRTWSQPAPP